MIRAALLLLLIFRFQEAPASKPPTGPTPAKIAEFKPFGDERVAQPRLAAVPTPQHIATSSPNVYKGLDPATLPEKLHIIGQRRMEIVYASSPDLGATFTEPKVLLSVKHGAAMRRGPRIATHGKSVVVTAPEGGGPEERRILTVCSQDGGATWSAPAHVTDKPGVAAEMFHDLTVTTSGVYVVTWLDLREGSGRGQAVYSSRSTDGGKSWSKNSKVYNSPEGSVCECCPVAIASGGGERVAIAFRNSIKGFRDLYLALSEDGGKSFAEPILTGADQWMINACPMAEAALSFGDDVGKYQHYPIIVINTKGELYIEHSSGPNRVKRWHPLGKGRRPTMLFTDGARYYAFVDEQSQQLKVKFCPGDGVPQDVDNIPALAEGESADSPFLALGPNGGYWLSYEVKGDGGSRSRLLRLSADGWSLPPVKPR